MHQPTPVIALPTPLSHSPSVEVLDYEAADGGKARVASWVRTFRVGLYWWLACVGAARMLGGVAAWVAVMVTGGANPMPAAVTAQPTFLIALALCAVAGGVVTRSWRLGVVLFIGAAAVAVADLMAPEPDPWAAGMPVAAAFAAALLLARVLWPSQVGRWVAWSLLIVGLVIGLILILGIIALALIGWSAR